MRLPYRHPHGDNRSYYRDDTRPAEPKAHVDEKEPPPVALYDHRGQPIRYKAEVDVIPFGFQTPTAK